MGQKSSLSFHGKIQKRIQRRLVQYPFNRGEDTGPPRKGIRDRQAADARKTRFSENHLERRSREKSPVKKRMVSSPPFVPGKQELEGMEIRNLDQAKSAVCQKGADPFQNADRFQKMLEHVPERDRVEPVPERTSDSKSAVSAFTRSRSLA